MEEEVDLDMVLDMKLAMHTGHPAVKRRSLATDVCPVRLAADDYILERLAGEDQLESG